MLFKLLFASLHEWWVRFCGLSLSSDQAAPALKSPAVNTKLAGLVMVAAETQGAGGVVGRTTLRPPGSSSSSPAILDHPPLARRLPHRLHQPPLEM